MKPKGFSRAGAYLGLTVVSLLFLLPIIWMGLTSIKRPVDATDLWMWPLNPVWSNFSDAWNTAGFQGAFTNTVIIGIGSVLITLLAGFPMAYAIVRYPVRGKTFFGGSILLLRILPEMLFLLPLYVLYRTTGLFDTKIGMVLAFQVLTLPYGVWLLRSFILDVPEELEDAARIDGCSEWSLLWRVTFPLVSPGLATTAVLTFITVWTSLLFPLSLAYSQAQTVSVAISGFKGYGAFNWPVMAAAALIVTLPQVVLFGAVNRYIISGLTAGAVKG
jgi:multiple sugar transport system permease protein